MKLSMCPQVAQLLTVDRLRSIQRIRSFSVSQSFLALLSTQVTHVIKALLSISGSQLVPFKS